MNDVQRLRFDDSVAGLTALLAHGALLRPAAAGTGTGAAMLVHDAAEARQSAWHRPIATQWGWLTWTDLRQREAALLLASTYGDANGMALRAALRGLAQQFTALCLAHLPACRLDFADDIGADFQNIVLSQTVGAGATGLFPAMLHAYRQGGWPCGWEGTYPQGRLRVFQPACEKA